MHPEPEAQLDRLVRALERIATGLEHVIETIDAVVVEDDAGVKRLRILES